VARDLKFYRNGPSLVFFRKLRVKKREQTTRGSLIGRPIAAHPEFLFSSYGYL